MPFCAYCGNEISELADACPKCGHPNQRRPFPVGAAPVRVGDYAGFWRRFGALLIDGLILGLVTFRFVIHRRIDGSVTYGSPTPWPNFAYFFYAWLMIALVRGQTLGKMALRIRITKPDGSPVDLGTSAVRAGMAIVSSLVVGLGYLWAAWDPEHRTWHDIVAGTRAYLVP